MSGGLIHLVAIDRGSPMTMITSNVGSVYSNDSIILNLDSIVNNLPRNTDLMLPEYILVDMNMQPAGHNAEYIIQNYRLVFNMGGQDKYLPLQILDYLEKASLTPRNKLKIPINFNYFFNINDGIPLVAIQYHNISVNIEPMTTGGILNNASIICKGKYLDVEERRNIVRNGLEFRCREINTLHLESTTLEKTFNIYGGGLIGGIILRINNLDTSIENITGIEFFLNGQSRHNFNGDLIDTQCQRLATNAIYIPMNLDGDLRSEINSNALNLSRIDDFQIKITTNLNSGFNITAYAIQPNLYRIMNGMIGIVFSYNLSLTAHEPIDRRGAVGRMPAVATPMAPQMAPQMPPSQQQPAVIQWIVGKIDFPISEDINCPIMYEPIDISQGVCKCNRCNNIFGYNAFKIWITEQSRSCPVCRNTNIENKYYTVSGEPITTDANHIRRNGNFILEPFVLQNGDYIDQDGNFHGEEDTRTEPVRQITPRTRLTTPRTRLTTNSAEYTRRLENGSRRGLINISRTRNINTGINTGTRTNTRANNHCNIL